MAISMPSNFYATCPALIVFMTLGFSGCGINAGSPIGQRSLPTPNDECPHGPASNDDIAQLEAQLKQQSGLSAVLATGACSESELKCEAPIPEHGQNAVALLTTLIEEYARYPKSFLQANGPTEIWLVSQLRSFDVEWDAGGITVPDARVIYLNVDDICDKEWRQLTVHHELFHVLDSQLFTDDSWDKAWLDLNPPGFVYNNDYKTAGEAYGLHQKPGFVTDYATTNRYEDRADTYAYGIVKSTASAVAQWEVTDPYLKKKETSLHFWMKRAWPELDFL